jgi:hypothetical protein
MSFEWTSGPIGMDAKEIDHQLRLIVCQSEWSLLKISLVSRRFCLVSASQPAEEKKKKTYCTRPRCCFWCGRRRHGGSLAAELLKASELGQPHTLTKQSHYHDKAVMSS